jgi:hypothetical protein
MGDALEEREPQRQSNAIIAAKTSAMDDIGISFLADSENTPCNIDSSQP